MVPLLKPLVRYRYFSFVFSFHKRKSLLLMKMCPKKTMDLASGVPQIGHKLEKRK